MRTGLVVFILITSACSHVPAPVAPPNETSPLTTSVAPAPSSTAQVIPTAIRIPSIKVNSSPFMLVGLNPDGSMQDAPLSTPKLITWFKLDAVPGDPGVSIIASHINGNGNLGGFAKLDSVKVGDEVQVDRSDGQTAVFKVVSTGLYPKADYRSWAAKVFGNTPDATLRLITCSGPLGPSPIFYKDNRIVFATLVSLRPTGP